MPARIGCRADPFAAPGCVDGGKKLTQRDVHLLNLVQNICPRLFKKWAPLFAKLSAEFERCVYGLNMVKNDLAEMQHPIMRRTNELLM